MFAFILPRKVNKNAARGMIGGKVFIMEKRSGRESIKRIGYMLIIPKFLFLKHIFCIYLHKFTIIFKKTIIVSKNPSLKVAYFVIVYI